MISDNITRDTEPGDNLIEHEEADNIHVRFNYRNGLGPLSKVVYGHNNVFISPNQSWVSIHKVHPPLGEETDNNDWMERGWMQAHFLSEHLAGVTLLNCFNTIFKDGGLELNGSKDFLGCRKLG